MNVVGFALLSFGDSIVVAILDGDLNDFCYVFRIKLDPIREAIETACPGDTVDRATF